MAMAAAVTAVAQPAPPSESHGQLLYLTHCGGCHGTQVHWRDQKLAKDWTSLREQVRRWQRNTGLGWNEQEIVEVTRYLNGRYYRFTPPARQARAEADRRVALDR
jgi:hypothetical protein